MLKDADAFARLELFFSVVPCGRPAPGAECGGARGVKRGGRAVLASHQCAVDPDLFLMTKWRRGRADQDLRPR